ncbi:MAG: transposase [candidate division WOR-3 bacterium]
MGHVRASDLFGINEEVIVCLDTSSIEKPHSTMMENIAKVIRSDKKGTVNGFTLISGIAVSGKKRALVCHRVFSRETDSYISDNKEHEAEVARAREILDRQGIIWNGDRLYDSWFFIDLFLQNGDHFVIRAGKNRRVKVVGMKEEVNLLDWAMRLSPSSSSYVKVKKQNKRTKLELSWGQFLYRGKVLNLVKAHLSCFRNPLILITDMRVRDADEAMRVYEIYSMRWAVEDYLKFMKECLGSDSFQVRSWQSIQSLSSITALTGGYIYSLGAEADNKVILLIAKLGAWSGLKNHRPGKKLITRGLMWLMVSVSVDEEPITSG